MTEIMKTGTLNLQQGHEAAAGSLGASCAGMRWRHGNRLCQRSVRQVGFGSQVKGLIGGVAWAGGGGTAESLEVSHTGRRWEIHGPRWRPVAQAGGGRIIAVIGGQSHG
jgi:hypothetical protein